MIARVLFAADGSRVKIAASPRWNDSIVAFAQKIQIAWRMLYHLVADLFLHDIVAM